MEEKIVSKRRVEMGVDLTTPLLPIAAALQDSAVNTHCAACFGPLSSQIFPPLRRSFLQFESGLTPRFCSISCSTADSPVHFASGEPLLISLIGSSPPATWGESSDLRLAIRVAHVLRELKGYQDSTSLLQGTESGVSGVLTNGEKFEAEVEGDEDSTVLLQESESGLKSSRAERVSGLLTNREKFVAELEGDSGDEFWKRVRDGAYLISIARNSTEVDSLIEEKAICIVLGNSIEVKDCEGIVIGAAIYSPNVSSINHSCVPNSCHHFILGPSDFDEEPSLKIAPCTATIFPEKRVGYGPRCVVRSILAIEEGEEVTASCINLLEPEEMRHAALRRRFKECFCKRCSNYEDIDRMLCPLAVDKELEELEEAFREASVGKCHCESLENFLVYGDFKAHPVEQELKMKLKPSNYLYVKAYKILATSFHNRGEEARSRMHPNVISRLQRRSDGTEDSALALFKASAAYCLRGAMSIHTLFASEPSILPIAAASWVKAGEGLIYYWGRAEAAGLRKLETLIDFECKKCRNIKSSSHTIDPQILVDCMEGIFEGCASYIFSDKMFLLNGKTASSADVAMLPSVMAMGLHCLRLGAILMNMSYGSSIHRTYIKSLEKIESQLRA